MARQESGASISSNARYGLLRCVVTDTYPPGWTGETLDLGPTWTYGTDEMTAWRFCPVCGERLLTRKEWPYLGEPICSCCERTVEACPCAIPCTPRRELSAEKERLRAALEQIAGIDTIDPEFYRRIAIDCLADELEREQKESPA